jgi:hypothetical protein
MPPADDVHAQELLRMFQHAKHVIVWIAIALLIKGHVDVNRGLHSLGQPCSCAPVEPASEQLSQHVPVQRLSTELLGNIVIQGDLTVEGCVQWRQTDGALQNLCTTFTETFNDCVHGVFDTTSKRCNCFPIDGPWYGNLCDRHTCFFRGNFDVSSGNCRCNDGYSSESMCEDSADGPDSSRCNREECQGTCIDNQCVCTLSGQLGSLCYRCASPLINTTQCPGRHDWGKDYIDTLHMFAVCGGGYDLDSIGTLRIRGLSKCTEPGCNDFHRDKSSCCNPLTKDLCPDWATWIFNADDFGDESNLVFNSVYQRRYISIIQTHKDGTNESFYRAHNEIQTTDWPLLVVGALENRGYTIKRSSVYLGMDPESPGMLFRAVWKPAPTELYLKSASTYYSNTDHLLHYIFSYAYPNTFCLGGQPLDAVTKTLLYGNQQTIFNDHSYWVNLRDKAGSALPADKLCGLFLPLDKRGPVLVRSPLASETLYFGPSTNNGAYYYASSYGTIIV